LTWLRPKFGLRLWS